MHIWNEGDGHLKKVCNSPLRITKTLLEKKLTDTGKGKSNVTRIKIVLFFIFLSEEDLVCNEVIHLQYLVYTL